MEVTTPKAQLQSFYLHYIPGVRVAVTIKHTLQDVDGIIKIDTSNPSALAAVESFFATKVIPWLEAKGLVFTET